MTTDAGRCPINFDHYDHALQDDPYPTYARLRDEAPLYHNEEHDFWVMSRHADLHKAFRTDDTFSNKMGVSLDPSAWNESAYLVTSFLGMDPPDQTRLRKLVSRGFTPKRVADLEPRIREISDQYLDAAVARGSFDWIGDFAGKFPMDVISEMLGVPVSDRDEVRTYADLLVVREDGLRDVPPAGFEAAGWLFGYYAELIADRKANPSDDLVSALINAEDEGQRMTDQELTAFLFLMVVAGNETTTKLLGNAVANISKHPEQRAAVFADASLVEPWIEETLRFEASSQLLARLTVKDFTVDGVTCPAGSKLMFNIGAANHDHEVFTDAESFDIRRDKAELAKHIAFGGGRHFCLGANLARLEAKIALERLVEKCSSIEVNGEPQRFYSANVRGYASLPVQTTAR
ncbi:cytochrome P450 [Nocardioides marmoriginsengisoli]|uniref:Cytochrome P450 n=1 Tax=Nocardioides marmoriginsengisoli TaxID=661483 RepID=A0A3N0CAZ0_9ACTN|nr:cytochrome P450 [Nocardioides marmoriginsengisoli]RNL60391.1 cytochrome P450 [Nocardioides marmoriginsengisoli]